MPVVGARSSNSGTANFDFGTTNVLSGAVTGFFGLWLKVTSWGGAFQTPWGKDDYPAQLAGWGFQRNNATNEVLFYQRGSAATFTATFGNLVPSSAWVHLAAWVFPNISGGGAGKLTRTYFNGALVTSVASVGDPFSNAGSATASYVDTTSALAQLVIYKDASQAQADTIAANLAAGRHPRAQAVAPVFYAPLDSSTSTETDQIGNLTATMPGNSIQVSGPTVDALGGPWPHHHDPARSGGFSVMGY